MERRVDGELGEDFSRTEGNSLFGEQVVVAEFLILRQYLVDMRSTLLEQVQVGEVSFQEWESVLVASFRKWVAEEEAFVVGLVFLK